MLNRVVLIGRLVADPELRYTPNGVPVASLRIAVDRPKSQTGDQQTDFINIVLWRQQAEFAANYLNKGRLVAVDGRLQIRQYTTQEGQKRYVSEVVAQTIQALDRRREETAPAAGAEMPADVSDAAHTGGGEVDTPGPWDDQ